MSAITVVAIVGTLACLAALSTAIAGYLREPATQPASPQPYTDHEIQQHAHRLVTQIERYLSR